MTRTERSRKAQESVIDGVLRSTLYNRIHRGPAVWTNGDKCPAHAVAVPPSFIVMVFSHRIHEDALPLDRELNR